MTLTYFTSGVTGMAPLSYQWYRDGAIASGKTEAQLFLANAQASDSGSYTLVASNPGGSATSSPPVTLTISPMPMALPTGQWDFKLGDLRATIGQPLQYFDAQVQTDTSFGTTTSFGIPDIGGQAVPVMYCAPAGGTPWGGYRMHHSVAPNGGGTNVNQYTLILDVYYPSSSTGGYRGLWQTETNNTSDSDLFVHSDNRIGIDQIYHGSLTPDTWHRLVFAFDLTQRELGKYIDGVSVLAAPAGRTPLGLHNAQYLPAADGSVDARWALGPTVLLLADGDDGEVRPVYVSSVQIRNGRMGDAAIAALGGPSASKIPGAAVFRAERSGSSVVIDWTGTVLESAPTLAGPWATVVGAAQPYTVTAPTDNRFYRVRQ